MTTLCERHGTLTKQDLDSLMAQLKKKCPADLAPNAFIADWQASLDDLAQAGQPISQIMATEILQDCFGPEYVDCWPFVRDYPQVIDRTVDRLCAAIITFSRGELLLLNAHTLIGANQVIALEEKLTVVTQKLQALEARQALAVKQAPAATW